MVTNITMKIKEDFFQRAGKVFELQNFKNLRKNTKESSLYHTSTPIGASMTKLTGSEARKALNLFKNVLGYSGERPYSYPTMLARDTLVHGLQTESLADEIYCQLIKQLTMKQEQWVFDTVHSAPNTFPTKEKATEDFNIEAKILGLLSLCLSTFPPSDAMMNFLEYFLRGKNRIDLITKLHITVNESKKGVDRDVPSLDAIYVIANPLAVSRTTGWLNKQGSRSRFARKRWFVLEGTKLHYFRNDKEKGDAIGVIDLVGLNDIHELQETLSIMLLSDAKPHVLIAENREELRRWFKALRSARAAYWNQVMSL